MRLKLRLYASLRERAGRDELVLELPGDSISSTRLRAEVERAHPELGSLEHAALVVGTDYVRGERLLAEGDDVALLPPVSGGEAGGAVDEPGLFALVANEVAGKLRKMQGGSALWIVDRIGRHGIAFGLLDHFPALVLGGEARAAEMPFPKITRPVAGFPQAFGKGDGFER